MKRIREIKYLQQVARRRKAMYALIGVAAFVMTVPTVTQVATKLFWQVALELTGELIAIAIASKIGEVKLR